MAADPLSTGFYNLADSLIDLQNFADYIIAETYYGNGDWSNTQANNNKYWHAPGKKWRMMLMDLDLHISCTHQWRQKLSDVGNCKLLLISKNAAIRAMIFHECDVLN